jgi:Uma2 family endonuclease
MGVPTINTAPMTVEEFYVFTDRRPDNEKWELIDGEPVLHASPSVFHQYIISNLIFALRTLQRAHSAPWSVIPGIGVRVSNTNRPEPDVMVAPRPARGAELSLRDCDNVIVAFEVLSPSTADRDLRWKRAAYASIPSLTHYVVVAQDAVDVVVFARASGFTEQRFRSLDDVIVFPALGVSLRLAEIYRDTGLE